MYTREYLRFAAKIVILAAKGAKAKPPDATEGVLGPSELRFIDTGPRFL